MKYYLDGGIRLYNGDCLEVMDKLIERGVKVDLILTDPPYNLTRSNNFNTMGRTGIDFGDWDKGFDQFEWLKRIPKLLTKDGSVVIFNDWKNIGEIAKYCEALGLVIKDMLRMEKTNPMPRNRDRRYITDFECAIWLTNKNAKWTFNRQDENYQRPKFICSVVSGKEKTEHTTQKPLSVIEELLKIHSNENDLVLDCFLGSGTTGVACKNLNRDFIGIELDEKYFDIAVNRIKGEFHSQEEEAKNDVK